MNRLISSCFLFCAIAGNAKAQTPTGDGYLAPAKILQCLRDREEVDALNQEMTAEKAEFDRNAASLQQEQLQLELQGQELAAKIREQNQLANQSPPPATPTDKPVGDPQLDRYLRRYAGNNGARRKHNKAVAAHKGRLDAHNSKSEQYNLRLAGLEQRAQIVDRNCAGAKVRPADLAAAKATLAAEAAGKPATQSLTR